VADAPFAVAPAARLDELRLAALIDRLDAELRLGQAAEALAELEALGAEHPLRENIAALHVKALYAVGRQAEALAVYEKVRRALAGQLGIDPSKELAEVHLAVLRSDPALAPPAPDQAPRTNLKSRLTSFVGRDEELKRIGKLLDSSRLVTLVGPGGAGKTRLAGEAAQRAMERFPDGAWLVELAPVTDPGEVPQAVLSALGPRETRVIGNNTSSPAAAAAIMRGGAVGHLIEALAEKRILLILDNCEHLVGAAADLAETLLGHAPGLRVLATSREPLVIDGESIFPVPPLALPEQYGNDLFQVRAAESAYVGTLGQSPQPSPLPGRTYQDPGSQAEADAAPAADRRPPRDPATLTVTETLLAYPAVRLFADRAAAVDPDFTIDAETLPDVIRVCRSLDGLPLAIELAAARLRTLPLHQIAGRLGDRFRLLTGGSRTAMPRHQTLRAVVAWSWELLSDAERDLAEALAVFPGGVTAEAAAAVTPGLDPDTAFDLLSALVDKSLLQAVPTDAGQDPRFRMLETLREYGADRLNEAGRLAEVRRAHAVFFRDLVEQAEPNLRRAEQMVWLKRLNAERDNILAAVRFAAADEDADTAVRIAAAMTWYWTLGDQNPEGKLWMRVALDVPGESPPEQYAIVKVLEMVTSMFEENRWTELPQIERQVAAVLEGVPTRTHPLLALASAIGPMIADDPERLEVVVAENAKHPDPWVGAMLQMMRGMSAENAGRRADVRRDMEQARRVFAGLGDRWGLSACLNALAALAITEGDDQTALELQDEALELIREINAFTDAAQIQIGRAHLLHRLGRTAAARELLLEVLEAGRRSGSPMSAFLALVGLIEHHRLLGEREAAWHYLVQAEAEADTEQTWPGPPQLLAIREGHRAMLHLDDGDTGDARDAFARAFRYATVARDMPIQSRIAIGIARYADAIGDVPLAARVLGAAEEMLGALDHSDQDRQALIARIDGHPEYKSCYTEGKNGIRQENQLLIAHLVGLADDELRTLPDHALRS
ncbi:MAG: AfsR/SARP family transcriptional regulator, partial [Catenulispora sp.]|nr:AfsR/SARP family transcriptional regulator [Catenulispora sp.]